MNMGAATAIDADAIRAASLRLHDDIRASLHVVARLASRVHHGDSSRLDELRQALQDLAAAVRHHAIEEQRLLDPFLARIDAWGPERVERLVEARDAQQRLTGIDVDDPDAERLVRTACAMIRPLARLLRQEEREALSPVVLRDDAIAIGQQDA